MAASRCGSIWRTWVAYARWSRMRFDPGLDDEASHVAQGAGLRGRCGPRATRRSWPGPACLTSPRRSRREPRRPTCSAKGEPPVPRGARDGGRETPVNAAPAWVLARTCSSGRLLRSTDTHRRFFARLSLAVPTALGPLALHPCAEPGLDSQVACATGRIAGVVKVGDGCLPRQPDRVRRGRGRRTLPHSGQVTSDMPEMLGSVRPMRRSGSDDRVGAGILRLRSRLSPVDVGLCGCLTT